MVNVIRPKRTATAAKVPLLADLVEGEIALNMADGLLYYRDNASTIRTLTIDSLSGFTTTDLSEGTNLYYTTARQNTDFDTRLATKSTTDLAEGTNLYYTNARVDARIGLANLGDLVDVTLTTPVNGALLAYNTTGSIWEDVGTFSSQFDTALATKTTTNLTEGTNLYFTDERVDDRVNGLLVAGTDISLTYNDGANTLTIAYTGSAGATTLDDLTDVTITTPVNGALLAYNTTGSIWEDVGTFASQFDTALATKTTTNLTEGTNLYYTQGRFDSAFTAKSTTDLSEGTNLYYTNARVDTRIGLASIDDLADVTITTPVNGALLAYNTTGSIWEDVGTFSSQFDTALATKSTTNLTEGTNLYYTDARVGVYGDARYLQLTGGTLTGTVTSSAQIKSTLNGNSPFAHERGGATWALGSVSDGTSLQFNRNAGIVAHIEQGGTSAPQTTSVITREKGDNRYVQTTNLSESIDDRVNALLVAGTDIGLTYDDVANTLTIAYTGTGGGAATLDDLTDVTITAAATGEVLRYNGTNWVDATLSTTDVTEGTNLYYTDARVGVYGDIRYGQLEDPNTWNFRNSFTNVLEALGTYINITIDGNRNLWFRRATDNTAWALFQHNDTTKAFSMYYYDAGGLNEREVAYFDDQNTTLSWGTSVVTRQKGDTRYLQLANAQTVTGAKTFTGGLFVEADNPNIRFDDTDTANNGEITLDNTQLRIEVDEDNLVANSAIKFRVDGVDVGTLTDGRLRLIGNQPQVVLQDQDATGTPQHALNSNGTLLQISADFAGAAANSGIQFVVDGAEEARITSAGMGINTTTLTRTLNVNGSVSFNNGTNDNVLYNASNVNGMFEIGNGVDRTLGSVALDSITNLSLTYDTVNNDRLRFSMIRESAGSDWSTASHVINRRVDATDMGYIKFGSNSTDLITFGENTTEYMRIDGAGNVGIGTTTPLEKLHVVTTSLGLGTVADAAYDEAVFETSGAAGITILGTTFSGIAFGDEANRKVGEIVYNHAGDTLIFNTAGSEKLRLTNVGRLGLNNNNPNRTLNVDGIGTEQVVAHFKGGSSVRTWVTVSDTETTNDASVGIAANADTLELIANGGVATLVTTDAVTQNTGVFWENAQTVAANYTITNARNAMSAGPITINTGITVTVGTGETWTIV